MEEKSHHASTQAGPPQAPKLEVTQGENKGETFKVKLQTKIGRERDNDVVLLDLKASRYHAEINLKSGQWVLEDLGSANGTLLNGMPVEKGTPLKSGDRITLGETEMIITIPSEDGDAVASIPAPQPAPVPTRPTLQAKPQQQGLPRIAWIAGALMLLVCFAAVVTIYFIVSRATSDDTVAENVTPPSGSTETGSTNTNNTPAPTSPSDASPPELTLAYEDDFSDSFGGWDDAFDTYTRKVYGNNRYQIEVTASNLVAWGLANRDVADFEIEVEARQEDGDEKSSYGLLFRFADRENFYRFDVSGDGFYLLSKFIDGEWITIVDWTESEFINPGQTGNVLKVSAFGPNITVWANGQQLAAVTDDSLPHGNFGFFAGTFSEPYTWVSYDNLKMWTPPGEEITSIPTATRPSGPSSETAAAPTATPRPPTATATPVPTEEEQETTEAAETATPAPSPSPTIMPTATSTPVPLPEYASRDQTLARGETEVTGHIVFPVYDVERGVYDIYMAEIADGENLELVQQSASQPALTEDGAEITYRSWLPDKRGLYARQLTEDPENAWGFDLFFESARPQFSPADKSLMYHSRTGGDAPAIYRIIDGVGQVMRREAFPIQGKSPKWSPDGQQFVYSSCLGSDCGIILSNIDGSAPVNLTNHPSDTNPEFSPDGSSVAFMSERAGNWEIYKVDLESGDVTALTSDSASDGLPTWSTDGSKIAFVSNRDGEWSIFTMDLDGTNKRRHFEINGSIDGIVQHDVANSFGWVEENIDWVP